MSHPSAVRVTRAVRRRGLDPVMWTGLVQSGKVVVGAVVAWVVAIDLLGLSNPILAPWAAVLVVHATVYRTFARGAQQVVATVLAVVLAWTTAEVLSMNALSLGVSLVVAFLVGRLPGLREESTTLTTTTIVVLGSGYINQSNLLLDRLLDTLVGVAVGLAVNLLVWPPMRDRAATAFVEDIAHDVGDVLGDVAAGLRRGPGPEDTRRWLARCREVDVRHDQAWVLVHQARESTRLNPRRRARRTRVVDLEDVLHGLEQAVAEAQSIVRTLDRGAERGDPWRDDFEVSWVALVEETAAAVAGDDEARLAGVVESLDALAVRLSTGELPALRWTEHGGLIVDLRHLVTGLLPVARWRHARTDPSAVRSRAADA